MPYSLDRSVGFMLGVTYRKALALFSSRLKPYDVTTEQFAVLYHIGSNEGLNQKEIAAMSHKDQPTTTRIVDLLVKKGLARRQASDADRRAYLLYLNPAGHELIEKLQPLEFEVNQEITNELTEEQLDFFWRSLEQFNSNLDRQLKQKESDADVPD
jgi:MarR family transcriptional regulator for hemolysin